MAFTYAGSNLPEAAICLPYVEYWEMTISFRMFTANFNRVFGHVLLVA